MKNYIFKFSPRKILLLTLTSMGIFIAAHASIMTYQINITNTIPAYNGVYTSLLAETGASDFFPGLLDSGYSVKPQVAYSFTAPNQTVTFTYGPFNNNNKSKSLPNNPIFTYQILLAGYPPIGSCQVSYATSPECSAAVVGDPTYCSVYVGLDNNGTCVVNTYIHPNNN